MLLKKTLLLVEELLLALAIAIALGTWFNSDHLLYAHWPSAPLVALVSSLVLIPVGLIIIWLGEYLLSTASSFLGGSYGRKRSVALLRWYYLGFTCLLLPLWTYASVGLPLLILVTLFIWRRRLSHPELRPGFARWYGSLEHRVHAAGVTTSSWVVAGALGLLYLVVALGVFAELPQPAGDEPHYLTTAYSLVTEGDFELFNNYERRDYQLWHQGWIQSHTKAGKHGIHEQYPMHNTGLAMLLAPGMWLALLSKTTFAVHFFSRLTLIIISVVFIALLIQVLDRLLRNAVLAIAITLLAGLTVPLLFFSYHIFTEMPVAILSLYVFNRWLDDSSPGWKQRLLVGMCLGFMPFLSVKYIFIAAALSLLWLLREFKWGFRLQRLAIVAGTGAVFLLFYFWQTWTFFGTISPSAYYLGGQASMFQQNYLFKVSYSNSLIDQLAITGETMLSFFMGQREALLFYSPWYLLFLAGLYYIWKNRKLRSLVLAFLLILVPFLLLYGATGFGGGHAPPARAITAIIWLFIIPVALFLQLRWGKGNELIFGLISFSLLVSVVLLMNPGFLYHDFPVQSGHIATWVSTPVLPLYESVPSVNNKHFENWPVVAFWALAYLGIVAYLVWNQQKSPSPDRVHRWSGAAPAIMMMMLFVWALTGVTGTVQREKLENESLELSIFFAHDKHYVDPQGFWVKSNATEVAYVVAREPLNNLLVRLRSLAPNEVVVEHRNYSREFSLMDERVQKVLLPLGYPMKRNDSWIYRITLDSLSGKPAGADPQSGDVRPLGVEVVVLDTNIEYN